MIFQTLFADKLIQEDRDYVFTFELPGVDGTFAFYPPKLIFWLQLVLVIFLQTFLQVVFAAFIYKTIIPKRGTATAYLLGWGVVIPIVLHIPFIFFDYFDVQNKSMKLALGALPTIVFFRCLEAMYNTSPHTVESSMGTYMVYYTSLAHFDWDPKTQKCRRITTSDFLGCLWRTLSHLVLGGIVLSVAIHFNYRPFDSPVQLHEYNLNADIFTWQHMANCYLLALLTFLMLAMGFEMSSFLDNMRGYSTEQPFHNPLFTSRSPTDFWNRRWNRIIHKVLKHAVFLPAKQYFPRSVAIGLTFLASGLLHDYSWTLIFYQYDYMKDAATGTCVAGYNCHEPTFFKPTAFFLWTGVCMLLERHTRHWFGFTKNWPTIVVSTAVVCTALPVSHWFTGDWVVGGYFDEFALGMPLVRKLDLIV